MPVIYSVTVLSNRSIIQHRLHVCPLLPRCYHAPLCSGLQWSHQEVGDIITQTHCNTSHLDGRRATARPSHESSRQSKACLTAVLSISCFELTVVPQSTNTNMPKTTRQRSAAGFNVHGWNHWNRILRIFINDIDIDNYLNCQLVHFHISCKTLHNSYF